MPVASDNLQKAVEGFLRATSKNVHEGEFVIADAVTNAVTARFENEGKAEMLVSALRQLNLEVLINTGGMVKFKVDGNTQAHANAINELSLAVLTDDFIKGVKTAYETEEGISRDDLNKVMEIYEQCETMVFDVELKDRFRLLCDEALRKLGYHNFAYCVRSEANIEEKVIAPYVLFSAPGIKELLEKEKEQQPEAPPSTGLSEPGTILVQIAPPVPRGPQFEHVGYGQVRPSSR